MGEMLERVADALQMTANDHGFRRMTGQAYYEAAARAAIAAMREPLLIWLGGYRDYLPPEAVASIQAMINAAPAPTE